MPAPDFSPIVGAIIFGPLLALIMSVSAIMAGIYVVWKGAKFALGALRGLAHLDGHGSDSSGSDSGRSISQSEYDAMGADMHDFYGTSSVDDWNSRFRSF